MSARPTTTWRKAVEKARGGVARRRGGSLAGDVPHAVSGQTQDDAELRARGLPRPEQRRLGRAAKQAESRVAVPTLERRAPGVYHNTAAVLNTDGSLAGLYRKMHIPDDPLFYEKYYFTPGDIGFRTFDARRAASARSSAGTSGIPKPRACRRYAARRSCSIPRRSAGIPPRRRSTARRSTTRGRPSSASHAIANGVYVAAVNRVGFEGPPRGAGLEFWGASFRGRPVRAGCWPRPRTTAKRSWSCECDPARIEEVRRNWPFLRDRRIDAYADHPRFIDDDRRATPVEPLRASACRPNGSRTRRPGSPGRTTRATGPASSRRSPGSTPRSSASSPPGESVRILVDDAGARAKARRSCARAGRRRSGRGRASSACRPTASGRATTGPIFVRCASGELGPSPTGGSTPGPSTTTGRRTTPVPARAAKALEVPAAAGGATGRRVVLEGGSIDVNGRGCC